MHRVLHVIHRLSRGGASRSLLTMAATSTRRGGFQHRVVSLIRAPAALAGATARLGIDLLDAPDHAALRRAVEAADIVQLHFWNTPEVYEWLRGELPALRLLTRVNVGGGHPPQVLTRALIAFSDLVAAGSAYTLDLPVCRDLPGAERDKLALLVPAADFARLDGLAPRPHPGFVVGYIGTVDFAKLHPDFVRMSAAIDVPGVRFIVCGDGAAHEQLARQATAHGIADRLELRGHVEDVRAVLESLDVFGYPLREDNYSSADAVLHEAMFAGVPPVVFDHGGAARTVQHGRTGLVVRNAAEYRAAIAHLFEHPTERARLGAAARAFARQHWGADNAVDQLQRLYRRLLALPKRGRRWPAPPALAGAACFVDALGHLAGPFARSLAARETLDALAADDEIARASPVLLSPGGGGLVHYRNHYRGDGHLRLWTGLALEHGGQSVRALAEYRAAAALGCAHPRLRWYQARVAARLGAVDFALANLRAVAREAPEIGAAREMLRHLEIHGA